MKADMLEMTVKVWGGNHVVSSEEEKERLQWEGFAEKAVETSSQRLRVRQCCQQVGVEQLWN